MSTSTKILTGLCLVLAVALGVVLITRFQTPEDTWICQDSGWVKHGNPDAPKPSTICGISSLPENNNTAPAVNNNPNTVPTNINTPETNTNTQTASENIIVYAPKSYDKIGSPVTLSGKARVFENTFNYKIKTSNGALLKEGIIMTSSKDPSEFGDFSLNVNFEYTETGSGVIEFFDYSAKDGSVQDLVLVPVTFKTPEQMTIKTFWGNKTKDPNVTYCDKTYSTERTIPATLAVGRASLEQLLAGPTDAEKKQGFFTSIPTGVKLQKLTITNGTAYADFSEELTKNVAGSCKVTAIRAQITDTLKQFPTVKDVVISVNGETEEILQP